MYQHKDIIKTLETSFRSMRDLVLSHAGNIQSEIKNDGTPQTHIDIEAEQIIRSGLSSVYPELEHFGEESGYSEQLPEFCCLIDALDGTKSYIKNEPAFTGMAVLIDKGRAVASVVYNYTTDEMFVAYRGQGAFKNGARLDIAKQALPTNAYCRERMVDAINKLFAENESHIACEAGPSGAGYGFSLVADGMIAARFNFPHQLGGGHIHDYAPGALLVEEAGGALVNIESSEPCSLTTKSFVACHPNFAPLVQQHRDGIRKIEVETAASLS